MTSHIINFKYLLVVAHFYAMLEFRQTANPLNFQQEPYGTTSSDDKGCGYDTANGHQAATGNVGDTLLHVHANRTKVEACNYLHDISKEL